MLKGRAYENASNHGGCAADRWERIGAARGQGAASGNSAYRSRAARPRRAWS
uniref:Uncharacterized protein n=1 Tax=Sinorhizobium fredii (strain NBRC 101917 / NGR234) TaxID=394 RepID=Q6W190_SINFN|nr:Hypothetical protein RNGR00353 [Sinorhizobium fredii NGR234]